MEYILLYLSLPAGATLAWFMFDNILALYYHRRFTNEELYLELYDEYSGPFFIDALHAATGNRSSKKGFIKQIEDTRNDAYSKYSLTMKSQLVQMALPMLIAVSALPLFASLGALLAFFVGFGGTFASKYPISRRNHKRDRVTRT